MQRWMLFLVLVGGLSGRMCIAAPFGMNLAWDECGNAGIVAKTFACDLDSGLERLVVSYVPAATLVNVGAVGVVVFCTVSGSQEVPPSWWNLAPDGCRATGLSCDHFLQMGSCASPGGTMTYESCESFISGLGAYLQTTVAFEPRVTLEQGIEYSVTQFNISHAKSASADSCAGCSRPMTLLLDFIEMEVGGSPVIVREPLRQTSVSWQGGALVPVKRTTWGQIKGLYR